MKPALLIFFYILTSVAYGYKPCAKKFYFNPSQILMVCVCNATYCDDVPPLGSLSADSAAVYVSSNAGKRFERSTLNWIHADPPSNPHSDSNKGEKAAKKVQITPNVRMQSIIGFGGAFTDAAGINLASLNNATQELLMQSYYGPNGLQYSLGRIPIASSDFSTRNYSYDDVDGDFSLQHFALALDDFQYKIPYIKRALALTGGALKLYGTPWSAPAWMKTNGIMQHGGTLKGTPGGEYDKTWAQYIVRFLEEYNRNGIPLWGLTVQNEPGFDQIWQSMFFSPASERDFVKNTLGPALRNSPLGQKITLMICDDQRNEVADWVRTVFSDAVASSYVAGTAVHWYRDSVAPVSVYTQAHNAYPNKFILASEACNQWDKTGPKYGDWSGGDAYAHSIISNLNNWVAGWTDWNIALDLQGGPNWVNNFVNAPVIVDASKGEFYKQPMFYVLGHFSKFIRPDSVRVGSSMEGADDLFESVAFTTPANQRVFVVRNAYTRNIDLQIFAADRSNQALLVTLDPESITTIVWN